MATESEVRSRALAFLDSVIADDVPDERCTFEDRITAAETVLRHASTWSDWGRDPAYAEYGSITVEGDNRQVVGLAQEAVDAALKDVSDAPPAAKNPEPEEEAPPAEPSDKKPPELADVLAGFHALIELPDKEKEGTAVGAAIVKSFGVAKVRQIPSEKFGVAIGMIGVAKDLLLAEAQQDTQIEELIERVLSEQPDE